MGLPIWEEQFLAAIAVPDPQIDLAQAALCVALIEYPDLEIATYLDGLDILAGEAAAHLPANRYPLKVIQALNVYLFEELGFQGNQADYYDPDNSFLNQVIERRLGIPISLAIVYREIAKRLDFPLFGIGMPGHFLLKPDLPEVDFYIDVFYDGEILFPQDCQARLSQIYQGQLDLRPEWLMPRTHRQILARVITNLKFIYLRSQNFAQTLCLIELLLHLFPDDPQERRDRGLLHYQLERWEQAVPDLEFYLNRYPDNQDAPIINEILDRIR